MDSKIRKCLWQRGQAVLEHPPVSIKSVLSPSLLSIEPLMVFYLKRKYNQKKRLSCEKSFEILGYNPALSHTRMRSCSLGKCSLEFSEFIKMIREKLPDFRWLVIRIGKERSINLLATHPICVLL